MEEEIISIICTYNNVAHTTGSWTHCCNCNRRVWISHSVINSAKDEYDKLLIIICFKCAVVDIIKEKDLKVMKPTVEQLNEITIAINKQYN